MPSANSLFSLLDQINHLKQLPRTGWLLAGVTQVESVADHSFAVAILALGLAETINADWAASALDKPLDVDRVIKIALVHDLAESILTDLPKRSAELLGREVKHAAEARAMAQLLSDLPNGDLYRLLWAEYDNNSSAEARLVRDADKLEMVHQALCYERRGQRNLEEFWQEHTWQYEVSKLLFEHLYQNRR